MEWEFPKISGPNLDPKKVGILLSGNPRNGPQFIETATCSFLCGDLHDVPADQRDSRMVLSPRTDLRVPWGPQELPIVWPHLLPNMAAILDTSDRPQIIILVIYEAFRRRAWAWADLLSVSI